MKRILVLVAALSVWLGNFHQAWALTNGTPATSEEFRAIVFLQIPDKESDGSGVMGYCNGTLLAPNVLITAAHCVLGNHRFGINSLEIEVGHYIYVTRPDGEVRRAAYGPFLKTQVSVRSYFLSQRPGPANDLAIVVLSAPLVLPEGMVFPKIISTAELTAVRTKILNYAPTVVTVNPFAEITTSNTKRQATLNSLKTTFSGYWESNSVARVQEGDSGAPLLARFGSEWRLIGITKGRAESIFSNWDVYGILDRKLCTLSAQIPEAEVKALLCR